MELALGGGGTCSMLAISPLSSEEKHEGSGLYSPLMIRIARAGNASASNGLRRVASSYSSTPSAHTSALRP